MILRFLCADSGDLVVSALKPPDALIFRVRPTDGQPECVTSQIVSHFTTEAQWEEREASRLKVQLGITQAWPTCISTAAAPGIVVNLWFRDNGDPEWDIEHETAAYQKYLDELLPLASLLEDEVHLDQFEIISPSGLAIEKLGTPSTLKGDVVRKIAADDGTPYIHRSVSFHQSLESWTSFVEHKNFLYRCIRLLHNLPPHPNIIPAPTAFTTANNRVTGILLPDHPTLDSHLETAVSLSQPIPFSRTATWFSHLTSALSHLHTNNAHILSLHPDTISISPDSALLLTDFTNTSANPCTLAPEADSSWTLAAVHANQLIYTPYPGPARRNIPHWPGWDVFPEWRERWPRAAEAAVVYAAGRTMGLVLDYGREEDEERADDAPAWWREVLSACVHEDPNQRMRLADLVRFWEREAARLGKEAR